ncbi:hypothetical protein K2X33_04635 [bacterium]|nr:hypothetical protein [bacterium]
MFLVLPKIDRAAESKERCKLIDKMGRYFHGNVADSWVRMSGGKLRGKVVFQSDDKGTLEFDANDVLDILFEGETK